MNSCYCPLGNLGRIGLTGDARTPQGRKSMILYFIADPLAADPIEALRIIFPIRAYFGEPWGDTTCLVSILPFGAPQLGGRDLRLQDK